MTNFYHMKIDTSENTYNFSEMRVKFQTREPNYEIKAKTENLKKNEISDPQEKYFYAIYDMTVRGSCSCYGHAEKCLPEKPEDEDILGMIYSKVHS